MRILCTPKTQMFRAAASKHVQLAIHLPWFMVSHLHGFMGLDNRSMRGGTVSPEQHVLAVSYTHLTLPTKA